MSTNALEIAQNIARSVGFPVPATLLANTNQDAIRLLQSINDAGRFLARYDWNSLVAETTISCSVSAETYGVPADFRCIVPMTIWKQGDSNPVAGPVRHVEWQAVTFGNAASGIVDRFHIRHRTTGIRDAQIHIAPLPSGGELFVYLYRRNTWTTPGANLYYDTVQGDNSTFIIDEYVLELEAKWRFLRAIGQPYGDEKNEAVEARQKALAEDGGMEAIGADTAEMPYFNVPDRDYQQ